MDEEFAGQIIKTADGNILMCGISYSYSGDSYPDIYLIKVNYNGDTLWIRNFYDQDQEIPFSLKQTQNGEFLISGVNSDNGQYNELYLLKVDNNGNKLCDNKIGPADWKCGYSSAELPNGDLMICGKHTLSSGYNQILLIKTNAVGNLYWEKEFGNPAQNEEANSIKQNSDGTLIITGQTPDLYVQKTDVLLLKVDQNGNQIFFNQFGGTQGEWGANLLKDSNDDNIITGMTYSFGTNPFMGNIFIITTVITVYLNNSTNTYVSCFRYNINKKDPRKGSLNISFYCC